MTDTPAGEGRVDERILSADRFAYLREISEKGLDLLPGNTGELFAHIAGLQARLRAVEAERDKERDARRNLSVLHEANCHYKSEARRLRAELQMQSNLDSATVRYNDEIGTRIWIGVEPPAGPVVMMSQDQYAAAQAEARTWQDKAEAATRLSLERQAEARRLREALKRLSEALDDLGEILIVDTGEPEPNRFALGERDAIFQAYLGPLESAQHVADDLLAPPAPTTEEQG